MGYVLFYFFTSILAIKHDKIKDIKHLDILILFTLIFFSSIRWNVGGDFYRYVEYYDRNYTNKPLYDSLFYALNYFFNLLNLEVVGKNILLIILFLLPFYYVFKKFYHNIYLSLCIFFPIIFIVYGLGSIRQGLAISYFFLFLYYNENKVIKYLLFFIPFFFHQAAIVLLFAYFGSQIINFNSIKKLIISLVIFLITFSIIIYFKYDFIYNKITYYILQDTYNSRGAIVRAILLSIFSVLFLFKIKYLNFNDEKLKKFLLFSSLIVIFLTPLSYYMSTPVDRILGFFIIIKLIISEEVLKGLKNKLLKKVFSIFFIFLGYVYLVAWLYFGENAIFWNRFDLFF